MSSGAVLARLLGLREEAVCTPHYNIAPTQELLAVRKLPGSPGRDLVSLRWGLVPPWAKELSFGARTINARAETAATKPSFRSAMRSRRCLIPASGYYEWRKEGSRKQPFLIHPAVGKDPFVFAGLWESWQAASTPPIETCTILTCAANSDLAGIHHRMPVILPREAFGPWLGETCEKQPDIAKLLVPCPVDRVAFHPVSTLVNNAKNDVPECLDAVR